MRQVIFADVSAESGVIAPDKDGLLYGSSKVVASLAHYIEVFH